MGCIGVVPAAPMHAVHRKDPAVNAAPASTASLHLHAMARILFISAIVLLVSLLLSFNFFSSPYTSTNMSYRSIAYYVNWYDGPSSIKSSQLINANS